MKNIYKISLTFLFSAVLCLSVSTAVLAATIPQIQTIAASAGQNGAENLNATITDLGLNQSATVYFQWGTTTNYGNQTMNITQGIAGFFTQTISGLTSNTAYHFRAVIQNNYGTFYGQDQTFISGQSINATNVSVQTTYATYISNFQATLNGSLSGNNLNATTNYVYFQWGTTNSYGNLTPQQSAGYAQTFFQNIANLTPGTTYHYRMAVLGGNYGTIYGQDMTFTTSGTSPAGYVAPVAPVNPVLNNYNGGQVLGASTVSTGLTNNFLTDSFFLPLLMIIAGLWFYFSGAAYMVTDKLKAKFRR